jgi:hypothetical protein
MNQSNLYATLSYVGCKILSFEDFPSNQGSWRVCFMVSNILCEVNCCRSDNIMSLTAKSNGQARNHTSLQSGNLLTDQLELAKVSEWIRSLVASKNRQEINTQLQIFSGVSS